MRTPLSLILKYSIFLWIFIKIMFSFVSNIELNDNSFELQFSKHLNNNYFEFIDNVNNEDFSEDDIPIGDQSKQLIKLRKRSKDVLKDVLKDELSTNELMSSSSVNKLLEENRIQTSIETNKNTNDNHSTDEQLIHTKTSQFAINCSHVLLGQYQCSPPAIDSETQQPVGCDQNNTAFVNCTLRQGLVCEDTNNPWFQMAIHCRHTNEYSYETALILSIFLGMFGADRFYLGYPALGLLKFCTLGFLFLGQLVDIILIAMQIVGPADGSYYVIKYFGPKLDIVSYNDKTDIIYTEDNNWYMT